MAASGLARLTGALRACTRGVPPEYEPLLEDCYASTTVASNPRQLVFPPELSRPAEPRDIVVYHPALKRFLRVHGRYSGGAESVATLGEATLLTRSEADSLYATRRPDSGWVLVELSAAGLVPPSYFDEPGR